MFEAVIQDWSSGLGKCTSVRDVKEGRKEEEKKQGLYGLNGLGGGDTGEKEPDYGEDGGGDVHPLSVCVCVCAQHGKLEH